jgi:hypothetical protein
MASTPIPPVTPHPAALPPMPAVARILSQFQPQQLASFVEVAIGLLDLADGDPDAEDSGDDEPTGDEQDASWTEFTSRGRHKHTAGGTEPFDKHEDTEEYDGDTGVEDGPKGFDPETDACLAGDDHISGGAAFPGYGGVHCDDRYPGEAEDAEREQMVHDVPMLPVVSLEPNPFSGERVPLGWSNLQTSFRSGGGIRSADTGRTLQTRGSDKPGEPV